jgi:prephenate dehydratase
VRVAYLGPAGTHSEEALRASAREDVEEMPFPTIYDAVMAVQEGAADRAVVPIENALEGGVAVTLDTLVLEALDVRIGAELVHPIHHCLIAAKPLDPDSVTRVVSHPQAIAQCARFLRERLPRAEHVSATSTADAVASLREADGSTAALGSRLAAEL